MKKIKKLNKGLVHIYTGEGKGKTTASMGLGLRAASSGLRVCMFQFLKKPGSAAENKTLVDGFRVVCFDEAHPIFGGSKAGGNILKDVNKAEAALVSGKYDLVILDEILNCVDQKFICETKVLRIIRKKPSHVELVLTGRGATDKLISAADYVTAMKKVKHPFDKGQKARQGVEY